MRPEWDKLRMGFALRFAFALFLCASKARAFPMEKQSSSRSFPLGGRESTLISTTLKETPRNNTTNLVTTSSLLFKDTKPILTYLLGQPKKHASLSSPAHLLSPDRYEFFTFNDDGQIVKKLMSVKEIQKIIANTEKSFTGEHGTPIEYYQILTVTPDVESIPSVSRINPNEPLFSIHDVIASVQNVLKSEINIKHSQMDDDKSPSPTKVNAENVEIFTDKSVDSYSETKQKLTSSSDALKSTSQKLTTSLGSTASIGQKVSSADASGQTNSFLESDGQKVSSLSASSSASNNQKFSSSSSSGHNGQKLTTSFGSSHSNGHKFSNNQKVTASISSLGSNNQKEKLRVPQSNGQKVTSFDSADSAGPKVTTKVTFEFSDSNKQKFTPSYGFSNSHGQKLGGNSVPSSSQKYSSLPNISEKNSQKFTSKFGSHHSNDQKFAPSSLFQKTPQFSSSNSEKYNGQTLSTSNSFETANQTLLSDLDRIDLHNQKITSDHEHTQPNGQKPASLSSLKVQEGSAASELFGSNDQKVSSFHSFSQAYTKQKKPNTSTESNKDFLYTTARLTSQQVDTLNSQIEENDSYLGESESQKMTSQVPSTDAMAAQETFTKRARPISTTPDPLATFILSQDQGIKHSSGSASTSKTIVSSETNSASLFLTNGEPAIITNTTYTDIGPIIYQNNWKIDEESDTKEELFNTSQKPEEIFIKVENLATKSKPSEGVKSTSSINVEISTSGDHISITPDLANSVSSVLWQIASENALLDESSRSTEIPISEAIKNQTSETIETSETKSHNHGSSTSTSNQSHEAEKGQQTKEISSENPFTILESILRTQEEPSSTRPNIPSDEEYAGDVETKYEEIILTSAESLNSTDDAYPSENIFGNNASALETKESATTTEIQDDLDEQTKESEEFDITTIAQPSYVVSISPNIGSQENENLKPNSNKLASLFDGINVLNKTPEPSPEVPVTQEVKLPRTTDFPEEILKEGGEKETYEYDAVNDDEITTDSERNIQYTTQEADTSDSTTSSEKTDLEGDVSVGSSESAKLIPSTAAIPEQILQHQQQQQQKEITSTEGLDITFVPMVIKTSSDDSNKDEVEKVDKYDQDIDVRVNENVSNVDSSGVSSSTENNKDDLESKRMPDGESVLPDMATKTSDKASVMANTETNSKEDEELGAFKHNFPIKFTPGRPMTSGFNKPIKVKPQGDSKPFKPLTLSRPTVVKDPSKGTETKKPYENHVQSAPSLLELDSAPPENLGLDATVTNLDEDIKRFSELCNELAFSLWSSVTHNGLSFVRSIVVSPFAVTSLLAMVFLGARGPTSGQMNDVLKLDDMVTFNPHLVFRNVTESLVISRNPEVATAAFVRELYSDKSKGKLLDFYKERAQQFYDGHVEEINFKTVGDTLRRQTNHLVKRQTWGKMTEFLKGSNLIPKPPLAAFGANIFQTDCSKASIKDRDGEMYFVILPASRLRRLVPIPAAVWRSDFLAGYEPQLDATAVSIGSPNSAVSTIFILPGQQGLIAPGDSLARLEHHLFGSPYRKGHWKRLMRSLLPRPGLELQIPRMSHKSVINVTMSLQRMGLKDLFSADKADLTGLNGLSNDLHLSDMLQVNLFSTCGEEPIGARHHSEVYPATPILRREKSSDGVSSDSLDNLFAVSDFEDPAISALPLELRPRQARIPMSKPGVKVPEPPRLRFDRPFLFFVRHNPTGLILHMGRFNPRLTP